MQTPTWLLRQPALLSRWLACKERVRRAGPVKAAAIALAAVIGLAALIVLLDFRFHLQSWMVALHDYWVPVLAVAIVHSSTVVLRRHRRAVIGWADSWLAVAPLSSGSVRLTQAIDSLAPLLWQYLAVCCVLMLMAMVSGGWTLFPRLVAAIAGGTILGAAVAWWKPLHKRHELREASRYTRSVAPKNAASLQPSDRGLAHWCVARAMSMGRPENARMLFVFVTMFAIPAGVSALQGLAIMLSWTIAGYLVALLSSVVTVASAAGHWLHPTPMSFGGFAGPIASRALLHQAAGTALAAAGVIASGSPWLAVVKLSLSWMVLVMVVYAIALRMSYRT